MRKNKTKLLKLWKTTSTVRKSVVSFIHTVRAIRISSLATRLVTRNLNVFYFAKQTGIAILCKQSMSGGPYQTHEIGKGTHRESIVKGQIK